MPVVLFHLAMFLAFMAVEMAIRERLTDIGALVENLAKLRNDFAHPDNAVIVTPNYGLGTLARAAGIINALFREEASSL